MHTGKTLSANAIAKTEDGQLMPVRGSPRGQANSPFFVILIVVVFNQKKRTCGHQLWVFDDTVDSVFFLFVRFISTEHQI